MLDHPNLIKVHALETVKDWMFRVRKAHLLIEYVNGKTLDACPRIPLPMLVQVFERVADGMVHMHRRGVYHSDLKPNNILVSRAGDVKIIDFGLARIKGEVERSRSGHAGVHRPGAGQAQDGQRAHRHLQLRRHHVPDADVPAAAVRGVGQEDGGLPIDGKIWQNLFKPVDEFNPQAPAALCDLVHRCLSYDAVRPARAHERGAGRPRPPRRRAGAEAGGPAGGAGVVSVPRFV